jgi:transposase
MLNPPPNVSILLCRESVNMQWSFRGLIGLVRSTLRDEPKNGTLFLFFNRLRNKVKILYWDGNGFVIWYKRLEKGTFLLPNPLSGDVAVRITRAQLAMILEGIDLLQGRRRKRYSEIDL